MLGPEPWNHSNSHLHATNKLISNFYAIRVVERKRTMRQSRDPSGIRFRPIWCQQYLSLSSAQVAPVKPLIGTALFDVNAPLVVTKHWSEDTQAFTGWSIDRSPIHWLTAYALRCIFQQGFIPERQPRDFTLISTPRALEASRLVDYSDQRCFAWWEV